LFGSFSLQKALALYLPSIDKETQRNEKDSDERKKIKLIVELKGLRKRLRAARDCGHN